jgi:nitrous oxidase accessory protein
VNKIVAVIVLVVTCFALILGAVIHAMNSQRAVPVPTPTPSTEPTKPPATPEPQPETEPSPTLKKYVVVPDDYAKISDAVKNAAEGATIYVKSGTYEGPINQTIAINKTLTIVGESRESTIIKLYPAYNSSWILTSQFFSYTDAMDIAADDFKLLNLTIITYPGGDILVKGNRIQIGGNNITRGYSSGITVQGSYCRITDNSGSGPIRLNGSFSEVARNTPYGIEIEGAFNVIRDNVCQGLAFVNSTNNLAFGNDVASDSRGYSGIFFSNSHDNFFYRNRVAGFGYGIELGLSSNNIITANAITDCDTGSFALGDSFNNRIYLNNMQNNNGWDSYFYDFYTDPWVRDGNPNTKVSTNFWDNGSVGNYWGDYNGSDANGDGIGDSPYTMKIIVRYFGGSEEVVVFGTDNFPLTAPVNIDNIAVELPDWVSNLPEPRTVQSQMREPVTQAAESAVVSLNSSHELEETQQPLLSIVMSVAAAVTVVAFVACANLLLYRRKRRREAKQG